MGFIHYSNKTFREILRQSEIVQIDSYYDWKEQIQQQLAQVDPYGEEKQIQEIVKDEELEQKQQHNIEPGVEEHGKQIVQVDKDSFPLVILAGTQKGVR